MVLRIECGLIGPETSKEGEQLQDEEVQRGQSSSVVS